MFVIYAQGTRPPTVWPEAGLVRFGLESLFFPQGLVNQRFLRLPANDLSVSVCVGYILFIYRCFGQVLLWPPSFLGICVLN